MRQDSQADLLAQSPMHWRQIVAIGLCVALNALDGFDVLSISFASPGIAHDWGINRAALGIVLSLELIGMAAGSLVLGQVADRIGRRPTVIGCLVAMTLGMSATTGVQGIATLAAARLFTGFGIGGMLAITNALVAEYANDRMRSACVALMAGGYPLGAVLGGSLAGALLAAAGWRTVFLIGAGFALTLLPLVIALLPEPVGALLDGRRVDLARINRGLAALGHAPVAALPRVDEAGERPARPNLLGPGLRAVTLLLTLAYFSHILTFYFILKWVPKIVVDMGFAPSSAAGVLVWANLGGLVGALLFSFLSTRFPVRRLMIAGLIASTIAVAAFGMTPANLAALSWAAALGGVATNGAVVLFYALIAQSFPTASRAGGTGFVIGFGRGGAVLGPILAGVLFQSGLHLAGVAGIMAAGSLVAVAVLIILPPAAAR
jgi:benzoate transport